MPGNHPILAFYFILLFYFTSDRTNNLPITYRSFTGHVTSVPATFRYLPDFLPFLPCVPIISHFFSIYFILFYFPHHTDHLPHIYRSHDEPTGEFPATSCAYRLLPIITDSGNLRKPSQTFGNLQ